MIKKHTNYLTRSLTHKKFFVASQLTSFFCGIILAMTVGYFNAHLNGSGLADLRFDNVNLLEWVTKSLNIPEVWVFYFAGGLVMVIFLFILMLCGTLADFLLDPKYPSMPPQLFGSEKSLMGTNQITLPPTLGVDAFKLLFAPSFPSLLACALGIVMGLLALYMGFL